MATGIIWNERFMWHSVGHAAGFMPYGGFVEPERHVDGPEAKRRFRNLLEVTGLAASLVSFNTRVATEDELLRFHTQEYIERIKAMSQTVGGDAGELTPVGVDSYDISRMSVGGVIEAVDAVLDGKVENSFALVRPPGHHAMPDLGRGFCIFGNAALAVMHARQIRNIPRVAIIDWDVHHGNGTQHAFYSDPTVLTISIHQDNYYPPKSGEVSANGEKDGEGYNINIPLPAGSGHGAYLAVFEQVVIPALHAYRPELILVASGLDANAMDPLGRNMATSETFRIMTRMVKKAASELCNGKVVLEQEGGYSTAYVPFCGLAVVEELSGNKTTAEDPFLEFYSAVAGQELQPNQKHMIDEAANLVSRIS